MSINKDIIFFSREYSMFMKTALPASIKTKISSQNDFMEHENYSFLL